MNEKELSMELNKVREEMQKLRLENRDLSNKFDELDDFVRNSLGDAGGSVYLDGVDDNYRRQIMRELTPGRK